MRSGRNASGGGGRSGGNNSMINSGNSSAHGNGSGGGNGGDDSFVKRISEMFMKWKVRPDVVLRGRHENKSKGALSAFWQDYKKVRVDWRARAGMRRDHFELALQHYMRIDGPSRDTCEGRIRYIWETRIRDNSHLGVVDVSCQPAKAKVGKRKPAALAAQQKEESEAQRTMQQQQQHFQRQQHMQADGTPGPDFGMPGLHQPAPSTGSSRLFSNPAATVGMVGPGGIYDDEVLTVSSPSRSQSASSMMYGAQGGGVAPGGTGDQRMDTRRSSSEKGMGGWSGAGMVKGEVGGSGEDDPLRKRPRDSWTGLGDPAGAGSGASTSSRGTGRGGSLLSSGSSAAGGKKDRIPNHWWELELTAEGPMLYPTSNCHEWTSDNGIEHRIMEIEFQHGCEVKPPKDRLIKDFTLNWRPNSDIVYVYETAPSGRYGLVLGMYEKQTVTHNKKFLYRQMQAHPWPVARDRGWGSGGPGETQMRSAWLFNDPWTGQWMIAPDYQAQPANPIYQYNVPPECVRAGTPCMDAKTFNANALKVTGCTTLVPPIEVLLLSGNSVREVCAAVWVGCFTANPPEVAFDLLCRLMSMSESHHLSDDSDRYAAEVFDAQRAEILAFFLVGVCEDPADRVVQREHYLTFMEWFVYTLPHVALPVKIWRMYRALNDDDVPFVSFPLSQDKSAFYSHRQAMSGPAIPGRFSFRFSRQPSCVTVDYTVQARAVEGRAQAAVMSYRIKISFIDIRVVMLRIENLLLRGDGHGSANPNHHGQGRMLEETSLVQAPRSVENGAVSSAAVAAAAAAAAASSGGSATAGPGAANGVHHESGLGSLERVIEQVDMEEIGGAGNGGSAGAGGRQEHGRGGAAAVAAGSGGGRAGGGGGGGGAGGASGAGNGAASGWTDMFQGMTVELAQEQAAQLPGDNSLGHLHNPAAALNQIQQHGQQQQPGSGIRQGRDHRPQHHTHHSAAGAHFIRQQHERGAHGGQQRAQVTGAGRGEDAPEGGRQQHFGQHGQQAAYNYAAAGGGRLTVQTGDTLSFFDDPPQGNRVTTSGPPGGGEFNLEFIEFSSFQELLVFFGRTLTERYDTSREKQETIPSPMYMHNMDD